MNPRTPKRPDLQSGAIDRSAIRPLVVHRSSRRDLNPQPTVYKTVALPLSYRSKSPRIFGPFLHRSHALKNIAAPICASGIRHQFPDSTRKASYDYTQTIQKRQEIEVMTTSPPDRFASECHFNPCARIELARFALSAPARQQKRLPGLPEAFFVPRSLNEFPYFGTVSRLRIRAEIGSAGRFLLCSAFGRWCDSITENSPPTRKKALNS